MTSTVNILFDSAFDQMDMDNKLTSISELLFSFMGDSLVPRGRITLTVDFREPPCHLRKFMEFLIVDTSSAYHGVLGRPTLKDLQTEARAYYMNALRKVVKREDVASTVMTIHSEPMDIDHKEIDEEMILDEGLDLWIIGSDSLASPTEELEVFPVNPSEPT
ncbi:Uncharacterized protein Adt_05341 [Abeliophyllum distichum]|uniref:Uncharacterized protein n=1 Tax=Abeliophyllum distichum TaxID=126358 RepID=A0ABD1V3T6_9LAMI